MSKKPSDYIFGIHLYGNDCQAFIVPKKDQSFDQCNVLDYSVPNNRKLGFYEESECSYSYHLNGVKVTDPEILKKALTDLGLCYDKNLTEGDY